MKFGYSILLGEVFGAERLQYHDCERFQIVCPNCREPVFKAKREAGVDTPVHYLSHYESKGAYQGDCDLRVETKAKQGFETENRTARNQRLQYFLSVLRRTVGMTTLYKESVDKAHWWLNRSPALEFIKETAWESSFFPNREFLFDQGCEDYLYTVNDSGWKVTTTFSLEMQRRIARDMWMTIMTPAGKSNYGFLFNHAFLIEKNGFLNGLLTQSGIEAEVSARIVDYMDRLVKAKKSDMGPLIEEMAATELPAEFNLIHGQHDDQDRSTYLTRIIGNIAVEMVGTLVTLPYFELLKQQYGDPSKVYPYLPGTEPVDEEEKKRIQSMQDRLKIGSPTVGH